MSELYWSIEVWGYNEEQIRLDASQELATFLGHTVDSSKIELDVDGVEDMTGRVLHYRGTARYRRDA